MPKRSPRRDYKSPHPAPCACGTQRGSGSSIQRAAGGAGARKARHLQQRVRRLRRGRRARAQRWAQGHVPRLRVLRRLLCSHRQDHGARLTGPAAGCAGAALGADGAGCAVLPIQLGQLGRSRLQTCACRRPACACCRDAAARAGAAVEAVPNCCGKACTCRDCCTADWGVWLLQRYRRLSSFGCVLSLHAEGWLAQSGPLNAAFTRPFMVICSSRSCSTRSIDIDNETVAVCAHVAAVSQPWPHHCRAQVLPRPPSF